MLKLGVDVYKLGSRCLNLESMFKLESMLKLGVDVKLESMSTWSRCQLGVDVNLESFFKLGVDVQVGVDVQLGVDV